MRNLLLTLCYDGRAYHGFQIQRNADTVQARLQEALALTLPVLPDIKGCSRTDTGVHARMFCVSLKTQSAIPCERLPAALNSRLPQDIAVLSCREVPDDFHARYSVKSKRYRYEILNSPVRDPFTQGRAWHCPKKIDNEGLSRMKSAAAQYVGKKDFCSFMAADSKVEDTVREVFEAEVEREGNLITFRVRADGFLYNMVRIFVGTLIDVAYGKLEPGDIPKIIEQKDRRAAGSTAPPHGLYLNKVEY